MTSELAAWILAGISIAVVIAQSWEIAYWRRRCRLSARSAPAPQALPETPGRVVFDSEGGYRVER